MAHIAVTKEGFVDGPCFTESPETKAWAREMEQAGMTIQRVSQQEARALWDSTYLPRADEG